MKKLLNFLSVFFGWLIWRRTGSIIIGALAAVILFPLIGPIIEAIFGLLILLIKEFILLFIPVQPVRLVEPRGTDTDGKGVRILIGAKDFSGKQTVQAMPPSDEASILAAAERTLGENKNFAYLHNYISEHDLPREVYGTTYRGELHFEKAIKAWRAATDINLYKKTIQRREYVFLFAQGGGWQNGVCAGAHAL